MGFFDFLKSKPVKTTTNEDQLIYDISGAIIAISDITTDELYEHSKVTDRTHSFDLDTDLETGTAYEAEVFGLCFATADQKEGMAAFTEKRKAQFTGA